MARGRKRTKPLIPPRTKICMNIYERIMETAYSYTNNKSSLSLTESVLLEIVYKECGIDKSKLSKKQLTNVWHKIKLSMKRNLRKGGVGVKVLHLSFRWSEYYKYFSILTCMASGLSKKLLDFYVNSFGNMPTDDNMNSFKQEMFSKWIEL